jgi:hypothetical protein
MTSSSCNGTRKGHAWQLAGRCEKSLRERIAAHVRRTGKMPPGSLIGQWSAELAREAAQRALRRRSLLEVAHERQQSHSAGVDPKPSNAPRPRVRERHDRRGRATARAGPDDDSESEKPRHLAWALQGFLAGHGLRPETFLLEEAA